MRRMGVCLGRESARVGVRVRVRVGIGVEVVAQVGV